MIPRTSRATDARTVFAGDERTGVKDPIVQRTADGGWQAWVCCHPLDVPGEEDRMTTAFATSGDGIAWDWHGTVLAPRPGTWDQRGARLTGSCPTAGPRMTVAPRRRRTGSSAPDSPGSPVVARASSSRSDGDAVADVRYLDVLALPGGGYRIWYEARLADESHELRTELIEATRR